MLVQLVQDDSRNRVTPQLDDNPHPILVRLVAKVGDSLELLVAHQLGNVQDELRLVDLIRQLVDDDL